MTKPGHVGLRVVIAVLVLDVHASSELLEVGDQIGVDWDRFDLEQFRAGMDVEYEHGSRDPQTDVTGTIHCHRQDRARAYEGIP